MDVLDCLDNGTMVLRTDESCFTFDCADLLNRNIISLRGTILVCCIYNEYMVCIYSAGIRKHLLAESNKGWTVHLQKAAGAIISLLLSQKFGDRHPDLFLDTTSSRRQVCGGRLVAKLLRKRTNGEIKIQSDCVHIDNRYKIMWSRRISLSFHSFE